MKSFTGLATSALALMVGISPAYAQNAAPAETSASGDSNASADADIIVMARKRAESIQNVPVSITAVNSAIIERNNIVKIDKVGALTPNVVLAPPAVVPTVLTAFIRGIGNRTANSYQSPPIAVAVDGIYYTTIAGSLVDIFDVEQIEILRGPQGTLQGRNSPGGVISVTTRRPSGEYGARAEVSYERFDLIQGKVSVEAPIVKDVLAAKISGFYSDGGDFMNNLTLGRKEGGGVHNWGGRLSVLFTPSSDFDAYFTADYVRDSSSQPANRPRPHAGSKGSNVDGSFEAQPVVCSVYGYCDENAYGKYETGAGFADHPTATNVGLALTMNWDLGAAKVTSVSGYRKIKDNVRLDADYLPDTILDFYHYPRLNRFYSQELRIASDGQSPLEWVVGIYALNSNIRNQQTLRLGGLLVGRPRDQSILSTKAGEETTKSFAVFGQASYKVTDRWSISGGARQSWDKKKLTVIPVVPAPAIDGSRDFKTDFKNTSIELGTDFQFDPHKLAYFRFAQGYRAGGFNEGVPYAQISTYKPETVDSYEFGLKTQWWDRRITANLSAFHYDYKNMQIVTLTSQSGGSVNRIINADTAKVDGIEFETTIRPTDQLTLRGTLGYLHFEYPNQMVNLGTCVPTANCVNLRNVRKDNAPKFTGYFGADYDIPIAGDGGSVMLSADVSYRSRASTNPVPTPIAMQDGYALVNGSITYKTADDHYTISIFGRNLTNKYYKVIGETGGNFFIWENVGRPRTYGIRAAMKF